MIYRVEHRDYNLGEFKITIAEHECRAKYNKDTASVDMERFVMALFREALANKDGMDIKCTVRTKLRTVNCSNFPFYTKTRNKRKELFRVVKADEV